MPMTKERYATFDSVDHDRRLDDGVFWEIEDVLGALEESIAIARQVLVAITVARAIDTGAAVVDGPVGPDAPCSPGRHISKP